MTTDQPVQPVEHGGNEANSGDYDQCHEGAGDGKQNSAYKCDSNHDKQAAAKEVEEQLREFGHGYSVCSKFRKLEGNKIAPSAEAYFYK